MSSSLCPHLVQEYFERVSEIMATYRPQILKQVVYDKISENLVLRGAVRQEEHEKIFRGRNVEGQVSQLLIVLQNRMWGLENLLAAFMEEHVSPWLTQEMFRAYMEHLVNPLKKLRDNPICQCVQISNSVLYRGWVKVLKSLDALILKTGNSLGFMKQTMYPTDNMLTFLSEKLAEYTGGDSSSTSSTQDELVPYGFAPNASGEVQVAELEEDDINDLFSLSETLSIAYHSNEEIRQETEKEDYRQMITALEQSRATKSSGGAIVSKAVERKVITKRNKSSNTTRSSDSSRERRSSDKEQQVTPSTSDNTQEKLAKQRELIARLSAPKTATGKTSTSTSSPSSSPNIEDSMLKMKKLSTIKQRPKSADFHRSVSLPQSTSSVTSSSSTHETSSISTSLPAKPERKATTGQTHGFVRSKSHAPTSPKSRGRKLSPKSKPTAVAKPTLKDSQSKSKLVEEECKDACKEITRKCSSKSRNKTNSNGEEEDILERISLRDTQLFPEQPTTDSEDDDLSQILPEMSAILLSKTIFATGDGKAKNLDYYQLNFDNFNSDNEQ